MEKTKYVVSRLAMLTFATVAFAFICKGIATALLSYGLTVQDYGIYVTAGVLMVFIAYWLSVDYDMRRKED